MSAVSKFTQEAIKVLKEHGFKVEEQSPGRFCVRNRLGTVLYGHLSGSDIYYYATGIQTGLRMAMEGAR